MKSQNRHRLSALAFALSALGLAGCNTVGSAAADLGLAGAGGVAGYQVSDGKIGGAAAGAALGYIGSPAERRRGFGRNSSWRSST